MANCGRNVRQGSEKGFGLGGTRAQAVAAATTMATTAGMNAGSAWLAAQNCPGTCPHRSEIVQPWGPARVRFAQQFNIFGMRVWLAVVSRGWLAELFCKRTKGEREGTPHGVSRRR